MIRSLSDWAAVALLAGSWLLGLHYYRPASPAGWLLALVAGTLLLAGTRLGLPRRGEAVAALAMLLPTAWLIPWPYRAAVLALAAGLALPWLPIPRRWPNRLGRGALAAGLILLVQLVAIEAYAWRTARGHELPWPLPSLVGLVVRLLGIDAAVDGSTIAIGTLREVQQLGATWELLVDPVSLAFFFGGVVLLGLGALEQLPAGRRRSGWLRSVGVLAAVVAAWLPIRAGLLVALFVHRVIRTDPAARLNAMDQFLSPWLHLALVAVPAVLACRFLPRWGAGASAAGAEQGAAPTAKHAAAPAHAATRARAWHAAAAPALVVLGVAAVGFIARWDPVGSPKQGRVTFVERHSTWEPTTLPYDTTTLDQKTPRGESSAYTYSAIYDYLSRFYGTSRLAESEPIDDRRLEACDVLVIKTPTARYAPEEVAAVVRFVDRGGGLLVVGDHTDFDRSSAYLNDVCRHFGFRFRKDLLFWTGEPFEQQFRRPAVPHPVVQHLPPTSFAVSCSIDPGTSRGAAVIQNTGLWSLPPLYTSSNFFPEAEYRADLRCGSFVQLWAARHGRGRVAAWTDSTIFSSFSAFEPGNSELMLGMLDWLNRQSPLDSAWAQWLVVGAVALPGLLLVAGGAWLSRRRGVGGLVMLAAALLGWTASSLAVNQVHRVEMPPPEPIENMTRVVLDRTVSAVPLSRGGFTEKNGLGYGLLEQWIPRLGYFTARRSGQEALTGDALVVICPTRSVTREFRDAVVDYVASGGRLLVIDSPDSAGSTANSRLLWPFGLTVSHAASRPGKLTMAGDWPGIEVEGACKVGGGTPLARVDQIPVAARTSYGQGTVVAIGFGSLLNDDSLGHSWMEEPTDEVLARAEVLFALVRNLVEDTPVVQPPPRRTPPKKGSAQTDGKSEGVPLKPEGLR